jgi:hypothetical protein
MKERKKERKKQKGKSLDGWLLFTIRSRFQKLAWTRGVGKNNGWRGYFFCFHFTSCFDFFFVFFESTAAFPLIIVSPIYCCWFHGAFHHGTLGENFVVTVLFVHGPFCFPGFFFKSRPRHPWRARP